jgi:class 3 adenylate cyclase/pimeloyl-ACP methyl ester carboxylesterase
MAEERIQRRLAAILVADVVGYTRQMETDEADTLNRLKRVRAEVVDPAIAGGAGRIVKTMGDGMLAEFSSAVSAVQCALALQDAMSRRNADVATDQRIEFRIGINLGDVIVEGGDIYGDGVNVAARLEALCGAGEVYVSDSVHEQVEGKLAAAFDALGAFNVKNVARPLHVYRARPAGVGDSAAAVAAAAHQDIRFCTAADGVRIAYATVGEGPPVVKAANWLNHLEYDWESPVWSPFLHELARDHLLVRYDARGNGLSDWDAPEITFEAFVRDLETVVDAAGIDRFALLGISQGCAVSVAYAVRHPERVTHLVLYGGFTRGRLKRGVPAQKEEYEAIITLMRHGWGQDNPAFRQIFTSRLVPDGTAEQMRWWNELQRVTASPENAIRIRAAVDEIDVSDLLPRVRQKTLVMHRRGDAMQPFEEGRRLAAMIPGARFVALDGRNHVILDGEKEWPRFLEEIRAFLRE